jgi:hypothetical protein
MVMFQPYVRLLEGIAKNGWRLSKDQSICHAQGEKNLTQTHFFIATPQSRTRMFALKTY